MAVNKQVSIKRAVLEAMQDIGIDHNKDIPTFTRWAADAERQIGSYYSYKKKITKPALDIDNCHAELPCDAMAVQRVVYGEVDCDVCDLYNIACSINQLATIVETETFLVISKNEDGTTQLITPVKWEVQNNFIVLDGNYDGGKLTVQYLGLETDKDGFPMIIENHVAAVIEYIMYRYARRSRFSPTKMDGWDVQDLRREWFRLCSMARAEDAELSETDRMEIAALINDPITGMGLSIDMHNRDDNYYR